MKMLLLTSLRGVALLAIGWVLACQYCSTPSVATEINLSTYDVDNDDVIDGATFQLAIDDAAAAASVANPVTIRIPANFTVESDRNHYLYDRISLVGDSKETSCITLATDLDSVDGRAFWFCVGIKYKLPGVPNGSVPPNMKRCNGSISNIHFKVLPGARFSRAINIFNTNDFSLEHCVFDFNLEIDVTNQFGVITSQSNQDWLASHYRRNQIKIHGNRAEAIHLPSGSEAYSLTRAQQSSITNNYCFGFGDDVIAFHNCSDCLADSNSCYSIDGRILVAGGENISVTDNFVKRIPVSNSYSEYFEEFAPVESMIKVELQDGAATEVQENILIQNNTMVIPHLVTQTMNAIRVEGGRNIDILDNEVRNLSQNTTIGIKLQADYLPGWNDPDNMDPPNVAVLRNVNVSGNMLNTGATPAEIFISNAKSFAEPAGLPNEERIQGFVNVGHHVVSRIVAVDDDIDVAEPAAGYASYIDDTTALTLLEKLAYFQVEANACSPVVLHAFEDLAIDSDTTNDPNPIGRLQGYQLSSGGVSTGKIRVEIYKVGDPVDDLLSSKQFNLANASSLAVQDFVVTRDLIVDTNTELRVVISKVGSGPPAGTKFDVTLVGVNLD